MTLSMPEMQHRLKTYTNPTFGYRKGKDGEIEKDLFDGELPKGWSDSPAAFDKPKKEEKAEKAPVAKKIKAATKDKEPEETEAPKVGEDGKLTPPYDQYEHIDVKNYYKARTGRTPPFGTRLATMIKTLEELDVKGG